MVGADSEGVISDVGDPIWSGGKLASVGIVVSDGTPGTTGVVTPPDAGIPPADVADDVGVDDTGCAGGGIPTGGVDVLGVGDPDAGGVAGVPDCKLSSGIIPPILGIAINKIIHSRLLYH